MMESDWRKQTISLPAECNCGHHASVHNEVKNDCYIAGCSCKKFTTAAYVPVSVVEELLERDDKAYEAVQLRFAGYIEKRDKRDLELAKKLKLIIIDLHACDKGSAKLDRESCRACQVDEVRLLLEKGGDKGGE